MSAELESAAKSSKAQATLGASASSPELSRTGPYSEDDDDPILATLKRSPLKKRNPNAKWDGRVSSMSIEEYRARKWSVDAAYGKVLRGSPSYTVRRPLPNFFGKRNNNGPVGDVMKSFKATIADVPAFSMSLQTSYFSPDHAGQGPAEYRIPSTMDPNKHPTCPKNCGARFGSEILHPRDPPGPAPGDYDPDAIDQSSSLRRPPNYTIQGREAWKPPTAAPGPGVGEYKYDKALRTGKITPIHWNVQGKTEPLARPLGQRQYESPSPAHYAGPGAGGKTDSYKCQAPVWKFGSEPRGLR